MNSNYLICSNIYEIKSYFTATSLNKCTYFVNQKNLFVPFVEY